MPKDPRYKGELRTRAASLYGEGKDLEQIARLLGISKGRAYVLALEGGATMRPRGPK